jgi:hypothetical protein
VEVVVVMVEKVGVGSLVMGMVFTEAGDMGRKVLGCGERWCILGRWEFRGRGATIIV